MTKDFWKGFNSVFSLFPDENERGKILSSSPPVKILTDEEAMLSDAEAIRSDWEAVGKDLMCAVESIKEMELK